MSKRTPASGQLIAVVGLAVVLVGIVIILVLELRKYRPERERFIVPVVEEDVGR